MTTDPDHDEGHDFHDQPFPERQRLLDENERLKAGQPALTDEQVREWLAEVRGPELPPANKPMTGRVRKLATEVLRLREEHKGCKDYIEAQATMLEACEIDRDALRAQLAKVVEACYVIGTGTEKETE